MSLCWLLVLSMPSFTQLEFSGLVMVHLDGPENILPTRFPQLHLHQV